jgi:hypothetical protein
MFYTCCEDRNFRSNKLLCSSGKSSGQSIGRETNMSRLLRHLCSTFRNNLLFITILTSNCSTYAPPDIWVRLNASQEVARCRDRRSLHLVVRSRLAGVVAGIVVHYSRLGCHQGVRRRTGWKLANIFNIVA